ncbi:sensor histidine kinase [bacterium]|nr:sensor histidine kinase [bacterium]
MDHLIAAAIHDAKNSLSSLGVWLDKARSEHDSPALHHATELAARVNAQLVELLALHRAGEGSLRLAVADHHLADFFADLRRELPPGSDPRLQIARSDALEKLGEWAFDAYLVKFVLLDARRNALRHAHGKVTLGAAIDGGFLRIDVEDDGPGFPEPTLQGEQGAMNAHSSGLGLSFARTIADRHTTPDGRHGRIELSNPKGARFRLVLP